MNSHIKSALIRIALILGPTYTMAYLTGQMVYVVPMLAAMAMVANSLPPSESLETRRVDDVDSNIEHDYSVDVMSN